MVRLCEHGKRSERSMEKETVLPKNIRQIGDIQGRERICIEDYVMTYIRKKEPQEEQGYVGVLLGERKEAEDTVYVFIRGILELSFESQDEEKEAEQKSRLKETWARERAENFPGWDVQGCCIIGAYPTRKLETLSEILPESGQMIYHLQEQEETLFWKESEQYRKIKGYFVFYEQNRKMQEYLAEVFQDDSVEKESLPDRAIKSFREKVKEKSEKKTGSLLKLASSFFVVTVLIIGAIVVNRIDEIRNVRNTALSELEALSNQTQQEGERLKASDYFATEQDNGETAAANVKSADDLQTAANGAGTGGQQNMMDAASQASADGLQSTMSTDATDSIQSTANITTTDSLQSAANTGSVDGLQSTTNTDIADSLQSTANTDTADSLQSTANTGTADGSQNTTNTGSVDSLQSTANTGTTDSLQSTANTDTADSLQGTTNTDTADSQQNASDTGASESEASEAASRAIRASYVIKEGDTLANICSKYYGSMDKMEEICDANHIEDANMIMPGQKIVLP